QTEIALDLPARLRQVMALEPAAPALQFEGHWYPWAYLDEVRSALDAVLAEARLGRGTAVGVVLRNRAPQSAGLLAVLAGGHSLVTMSGLAPDARLNADIGAQRLPVLVAGTADWHRSSLTDAVAHSGALGVELTENPDDPVRVRMLPDRRRLGELRDSQPDVAVEMLTSGTTGPPKRVNLTWANLEAALLAATVATHGDEAAISVRLRSGVALAIMPLSHISGLWVIVDSAWQGRPVCLLERFDVEAWINAVQEHRPVAVSLPPAAIRMVLDAGVPAEVFRSVRGVVSGTAPLDPALARSFEERYGVPVLPVYGATEFTGPVAGWTLDDHRRFGESKRGSVGRAYPGFELRVVDQAGSPVGPGEKGLLEVRGPQVGGAADGSWVRTSDRARLDADGFLWILGRVDDAILRGGFKIHPDEVVTALESHPAVREAAVVGLPDPR